MCIGRNTEMKTYIHVQEHRPKLKPSPYCADGSHVNHPFNVHKPGQKKGFTLILSYIH